MVSKAKHKCPLSFYLLLGAIEGGPPDKNKNGSPYSHYWRTPTGRRNFSADMRKPNMKDAHNRAAEHQGSAAKSDRVAADSHGKSDHTKGKEHATQAHLHAQNASEHSKTGEYEERPTEVKTSSGEPTITSASQWVAHTIHFNSVGFTNTRPISCRKLRSFLSGALSRPREL